MRSFRTTTSARFRFLAAPDDRFLAGETEMATIDLSLDEAQRLAASNSPAGRMAMEAAV